jgi:hypothetical protein
MENTEPKYENYTPSAMAALRSAGHEGESLYAGMRDDWVARGKPRIAADASHIPPSPEPSGALPSDFPKYECFTPDALARLRSSGDAGALQYKAMRSTFEDEGEPPRRADAANVVPVHGEVYVALDETKALLAAEVGNRKYEDYTVDEMATAREYGQLSPAAYKTLRKDWENRGKPAIRTA